MYSFSRNTSNKYQSSEYLESLNNEQLLYLYQISNLIKNIYIKTKNLNNIFFLRKEYMNQLDNNDSESVFLTEAKSLLIEQKPNSFFIGNYCKDILSDSQIINIYSYNKETQSINCNILEDYNDINNFNNNLDMIKIKSDLNIMSPYYKIYELEAIKLASDKIKLIAVKKKLVSLTEEQKAYKAYLEKIPDEIKRSGLFLAVRPEFFENSKVFREDAMFFLENTFYRTIIRCHSEMKDKVAITHMAQVREKIFEHDEKNFHKGMIFLFTIMAQNHSYIPLFKDYEKCKRFVENIELLEKYKAISRALQERFLYIPSLIPAQEPAAKSEQSLVSFRP